MPASNPARIHASYTCPINPPDASPVLTQSLVWAALQRKIRHAEEFVPAAIRECEVLEEDEDGTVTRDVKFVDGMGPGGKTEAREVCRSFAESWVDFHQSDGTVIRNVVSHGAGLDDASLFMTYIFEVKHPEIEAGSVEARELYEKTKRVSVVTTGVVRIKIVC